MLYNGGIEMNINLLIKMAIQSRDRAYAPYSKFKVGAAVLTEDSSIYTGCNIENSSYGATNCAERTAIFKAISEGHTNIKVIAVVGDKQSYLAPCGICRQVILEFATKDIKIILAKNLNDYIVKSMEEILPLPFSKNDL